MARKRSQKDEYGFSESHLIEDDMTPSHADQVNYLRSWWDRHDDSVTLEETMYMRGIAI